MEFRCQAKFLKRGCQFQNPETHLGGVLAIFHRFGRNSHQTIPGGNHEDWRPQNCNFHLFRGVGGPPRGTPRGKNWNCSILSQCWSENSITLFAENTFIAKRQLYQEGTEENLIFHYVLLTYYHTSTYICNLALLVHIACFCITLFYYKYPWIQ